MVAKEEEVRMEVCRVVVKWHEEHDADEVLLVVRR